MNRRPLVSVDWLREHLHDDDVRVVDASWHMPATGRAASVEFYAAHIPGAVYFDIDAHAAPVPLPHMLPDSDSFAHAAASLGLSEQHRIVVYDTAGIFSAARVWWMFRHFGAAKAVVLDGGFPAWLKSGAPVHNNTSPPETSRFNPAVSGTHYAVAEASDVLQASTSGLAQILDARSQARFTAEEKEVRQGLRSGHIPGSWSLPFTDLVDDGFLKSDEMLRQLLQDRGIDLDRPMITTCGSGVTAAIINLAMECLGVDDVALYDGSWTEWGGLPELPVETG